MPRAVAQSRLTSRAHVWVKLDFLPGESCRHCGIMRKRDESKPYNACRGPVTVSVRCETPTAS